MKVKNVINSIVKGFENTFVDYRIHILGKDTIIELPMRRFTIGITITVITYFILLMILTAKLGKLNDKIDCLIGDIHNLEYKLSTPQDTLKMHVLNYIIDHEGFRDKPYKDIAGNLTIGFGHKIKDNESFNKITWDEATDLLAEDFQLALDAAVRLSPILKHPDNIFKKYAIAHFIYGKGSGSYAASSLRTKVNNNEPIEEEMRRWNIVTVQGKKIPSQYLANINEWRIELYNTNK